MWASILQNGRKIKKEDDSVDKIKQYIRLTDKSSYTSKLSKSAVGILRTESIKKNGKEYTSFILEANKILQGQYKNKYRKTEA